MSGPKYVYPEILKKSGRVSSSYVTGEILNSTGTFL